MSAYVSWGLFPDVVEVVQSHTGFNLAVAFAGVLNDFRIADKVSNAVKCTYTNDLP
jgi:hypothetical protein